MNRLKRKQDDRPKAFWGALISAGVGIANALINSSAQKKQRQLQANLEDYNNSIQEAQGMTNALNAGQDYQQNYLQQFKQQARLGTTRRLGGRNIMITDGGNAKRIGNNTYLLRGGSHEDINETGQTGIGINVGGNEIEAEGGEVAQRKGNSLRIYSAQPILGGMSPAQAILRGYNKDAVFSQQQAFKKRNGLKDDGSKAAFGNLINIPDIANRIVEYFSGIGRYASKPVKVTPKTVAKKPIRNGQVGDFRIVNGRRIPNEKPLRRVYPEFDIVSMGRGLPVGKSAKAIAKAAKNEVNYINQISKSRLYSDNPIVNSYATYARRYNLPDKARVPYMIRRVKSDELPSINNGRIKMSGGRFNHTNFTYDRPVVSHRKGKWDTAQQTYLINGRTLVSENKGNWGSIEPSDMFTVRDLKEGLTVPTKDVILVSGHKGILSQAKASGIKTATSPQLQRMEEKITPRESFGRFNFAGGERRHYNTPYWISVNDIVKDYGTPKFKDVQLLEKMTGLKSGVSKLNSDAIKIINDAKGFDKLSLNEAEQVMKQIYPNGRNVNFVNDREAYITGELPYNNLFYDPATYAESKYAFPKRLGGRCKFRNGGLTSKDRGSSKHPYSSVSSKDFAGGNRSYPIPTKADAIDALRLVDLHGRSDVRGKVYSKYPELRKKADFGTWVRTNRNNNVLANFLYESGITDNIAWKSMLRDIHTFTGMGSDPYSDDQDEAVVTPVFGISNTAQLLKNVQQANKLTQAVKASQVAQRISYAAKQAKDFYRDLGINIPVGRNNLYNPTFRSYALARNIENSNKALQMSLHNTHLPKGIRLTPIDKSSIGRTAARIINPREAETVRTGINIAQSARNMTSGANPFLYAERTPSQIRVGLNRTFDTAKQGVKNAGQKVKDFGNKVRNSNTYRTRTGFEERYNPNIGAYEQYNTYKLKPWVKATAGAAGTAGVIGLGIGLSNVKNKNENNKTQLDAKGQPISTYIARPQEPVKTQTRQVPSSIARKDTTKQVNKVVKRQVRTTPQYTGNTTRGNYQLHEGETKVINGVKYTRRGNTIINHKTNVGYIYDKNGNYTSQADYSKVGNFNQAFDAARAAGRNQFIYHAGKYNNYSTVKETNAKKEALNRRIGARRIAKRMGGLTNPPVGSRKKYLPGGIANPWDEYRFTDYPTPNTWNERYGITNIPNYGGTAPWQISNKYAVNAPYSISKYDLPITTVSAKKDTFNDEMSKRMKAGVQNLKDNSDSKTTVPYLGKQSSFKPTTQDYIGLGIDTLASLGIGLINSSAAGKTYLPERPAIIQASKLPTYYNVAPEVEEIKRQRDILNGEIANNTSSSVAALNRISRIRGTAAGEINKLYATKENEENKMLTQDALNQQQVAAENAKLQADYETNKANILNAATQAKANALSGTLSGLSQAWTNFASSVENRYDSRQNEIAAISSANSPSVVKNAISLGYNLSPEVLANLYKNSKNNELRNAILGRLSANERKRYGIE